MEFYSRIYAGILFFIFSFLPTLSLYAQNSIGLEGGLSNNTLNTNISNRASTVLSANTGFSIGVPFRCELKPWLFATMAPGIIGKGYTSSRTGSLYGIYEQWTNNYLQVPIGVGFVYGRRLKCSVDPGIYAGYWLSGKVKGSEANIFGVIDSTGPSGPTTERFRINNYDERYHFLSQRDNRWEFGWTMALGLQYRLTGKYSVTASGRYYQSLTSQEKTGTGQNPGYNQTWTFSIGGLLDLPKK